MARFQKTRRQISSLQGIGEMYGRNILKEGFKMNEANAAGNYGEMGAAWARKTSMVGKRDMVNRREFQKRFQVPGGIQTREGLNKATTQQPWYMKPGGRK